MFGTLMKRLLYLLVVLGLSACATQGPPNTPTVTIAPLAPEQTSNPPEAASAAPTPSVPADTLAAAILDLKGYITAVHDPALIKEGKNYYLVSTGAGVPIRCSADMREWEFCGRVSSGYPDWVGAAVPGVRDLWAPDISLYSGKYHLYYSGSSFGSNRSVIGLATNVTLDSKDARYNWVDQGEVIASRPGNDYNAIDPNLALDRNGQPWLSFGSFWSGIQLVKIDAATGKPAPGAELISIASNPGSDAIEAPFIVQREDYYYLFVSHDFCCQGVESTYKIKMGRAKEITGPYVDREGKPLLGGGGTLVYAGSTRWRGPGHNAIWIENDTYYLVYHSYDAQAMGEPTLRIEKLFWDDAGWAWSPSALLGK